MKKIAQQPYENERVIDDQKQYSRQNYLIQHSCWEIHNKKVPMLSWNFM